MAHLHHRHAGAVPVEHFVGGLAQDRLGEGGGAGAEVEGARHGADYRAARSRRGAAAQTTTRPAGRVGSGERAAGALLRAAASQRTGFVAALIGAASAAALAALASAISSRCFGLMQSSTMRCARLDVEQHRLARDLHHQRLAAHVLEADRAGRRQHRLHQPVALAVLDVDVGRVLRALRRCRPSA